MSWLFGSWFQSFLFFGSLVPQFLGVEVSWPLNFKVLSIQETFNVFKNGPYNQIAISCVLEDNDPISKISKNILDGSSGCVGVFLFIFFRTVESQKS